MKINGINNANAQSGQSFKGVNLYRNCFGIELIQIWNTAKKDDGKVLLNGQGYYPLAKNSKAAKDLTNMLRTLGEKITQQENMKNVRELLTQIVGVDILPEANKLRHLEQNRTFRLKNLMGGDVVIENYKTVAQKGNPEYHAKGSKSESSYEILSIELDPQEKVNITLTREELAKLKKPQP